MQEVKESHIKELKELLSHFMALKNNDSAKGHHFGTVVDNNDPGKQGRCKIRVRQVFDGLPDSDLPWAMPDQNFVGSLVGNFIVPENGALVNVYFRDDDLNFPHYTTKVLDRNNLSSLKDEDYPHMFILYETDNGDYLKINKKTNEFIIRSASGTIVTINKDGNMDIDTTNSLRGTIDITARGQFTMNAPIIEGPDGSVVPSASGFMQALKFDVLTGAPCSGKVFVRQGI